MNGYYVNRTRRTFFNDQSILRLKYSLNVGSINQYYRNKYASIVSAGAYNL